MPPIPLNVLMEVAISARLASNSKPSQKPSTATASTQTAQPVALLVMRAPPARLALHHTPFQMASVQSAQASANLAPALQCAQTA